MTTTPDTITATTRPRTAAESTLLIGYAASIDEDGEVTAPADGWAIAIDMLSLGRLHTEHSNIIVADMSELVEGLKVIRDAGR